MERVKVKSRNIVAVGYEKGILEIEFYSGKIYRYVCPEDIYTKMMQAESKGSYFHKGIKGKFAFKEKSKLDGIKEDIRFLLHEELTLLQKFIVEIKKICIKEMSEEPGNGKDEK